MTELVNVNHLFEKQLIDERKQCLRDGFFHLRYRPINGVFSSSFAAATIAFACLPSGITKSDS